MGKLLIFLSIVILAMMSIGASVSPQNPMFLLASVTATYQHIREVLIAVLAIQFVTRPPRHVWFRILAGLIATVATVWTIQQTYSYHMQLFDALSILGASVAIIITALERKAINMDLYYSRYLIEHKVSDIS